MNILRWKYLKTTFVNIGVKNLRSGWDIQRRTRTSVKGESRRSLGGENRRLDLKSFLNQSIVD